jgi:hypothetical protein
MITQPHIFHLLEHHLTHSFTKETSMGQSLMIIDKFYLFENI